LNRKLLLREGLLRLFALSGSGEMKIPRFFAWIAMKSLTALKFFTEARTRPKINKFESFINIYFT
jgi:hypothetical protein